MGVLVILLLLLLVGCIAFGVLGFVLKLVYILAIGVPVGLIFAVAGLVFCVTVIGIPLGMLMFKLARFLLYPF